MTKKNTIVRDYLNKLYEQEKKEIEYNTGYDEDAPDEFGEEYNSVEGQPDEDFVKECSCVECKKSCHECTCNKVKEQMTSSAAGIGGWESIGNNEKERSGIKKSTPFVKY
jgi:hypothetical protein